MIVISRYVTSTFQMELKVSVDGVERSISGVSNETTCAQIIYALAHAISQKGRFVMIEKYRNRVSPSESAVQIIGCHNEFLGAPSLANRQASGAA